MKITSKLVGLALAGLSVFGCFNMPLYAAEEKTVLTLEDAVKSAITHSNEMVLNTMEQNKLKEQLKARKDDSYYSYQTTYLKKAQNKQQGEIVEDQIKNDITNKYNELISLEKEISILNKNISIKSKEAKVLELKGKSGLANPLELQKIQIELESLKISKEAKLEELKNAQAYFRIITNKDVNEYKLDEERIYETFRIESSVEGYISSKIEKYLQYDKEIADLNKSNLVDTEGMPISYEVYLENKYSADAANVTLEEKKKNLKQSLMTTYSNLFKKEGELNTVVAELKLAEKELKAAEIRYKNGLLSEMEYEKKLVFKNQKELEEFNFINECNNLKETLQKPWVASR